MKTIIKLLIFLLPIVNFGQSFINSQYLYERDIDMRVETNDCSVRAIAVAYDITYFASSEVTYKIGRRRGEGMILRKFVKYLSQNIVMGKRIANMETLTTPLSVETIQSMDKYKDRNLFLVTTDHIFNLKNNVVYGNTNDNKIKDVKWILEIKPFNYDK